MKKLLAFLLSLSLLLVSFAFPASAARALGDVDGNGTVTSADARLALRIAVKLEPYGPGSPEYTAADFDCDGEVRASDARAALRTAVSLPPFNDFAERMKTDVLDVCLGVEPDTLDPALNSATDASSVLVHLFSGLAKWKQDVSGAYTLVPDAAVYLPVGRENPDGTVTYTYTLRDGMTWSDGRPVTAQDFVFAWNRAASPALNADYSYIFEVVDGYAEMWDTEDPDAKLNVRAVDDLTLEVTLVCDVPYWNELLAFPVFFPVRSDAVENGSWCYDPSTYLCNGAYTMTAWEHGSVITLEKNENYYNAVSVNMKRLNFRLCDDDNDLLANFRSGAWQFVDQVPYDLPLDAEIASGALKTQGQCGTYYFQWNVDRSLLPAGSGLSGAAACAAEAEIRNAVNALFDRGHIAMGIVGGGQIPASSFVGAGMTDADGKTEFYKNAGGNPFTGYYDMSAEGLAAARTAAVETLKKYYAYDSAAGKFTNFPALTYIYNTSGAHEEIGRYIGNVLADLGIRVELQGLSWPDFLQARSSGDYDLARGGWVADYNDPVNFLDMWVSASGNNDVGFGKGSNSTLKGYSLDLTSYGYDIKVENGTWSETYDVLISVIKRCVSKTVRYQLMHLAEDMLMATGCVCPLYYYADSYLMNPALQGFFSTPLGVKYFMYTGMDA